MVEPHADELVADRRGAGFLLFPRDVAQFGGLVERLGGSDDIGFRSSVSNVVHPDVDVDACLSEFGTRIIRMSPGRGGKGCALSRARTCGPWGGG